MKKTFLSILFLLNILIVISQEALTIDEVVINSKFEYPEFQQKIDFGNDSSVLIKNLTSDGKVIMTGKLQSSNSYIKEGRFTYYNMETKPIVIGNYSNNIPIGIWQYFDENGTVIKQLDYTKAIDYLSKQKNVSDFIYIIDKMPVFKTGDYNDFSEYLISNITFPINALMENINETLLVTFIVNKNGEIVNPEFLYGQNVDLNIEIVRVLSESPRWTPGYNKKGEPFNIKYTYPIKFKTNKKGI